MGITFDMLLYEDMADRSKSMKDRWASISVEERSKIMSERKKKGDAKRTPEERKAHAAKATAKRWKSHASA